VAVMWCSRPAFLVALASFTAGCAATYAPRDLPPPTDFSVDGTDGGVGGNGEPDLATASRDLAAAATHDLALAGAADLTPACAGSVDDGGVAPAVYLVAPAAGTLFAARLRGGVWSALPPTAGNVTDVALAAVGGRPLVAARLGDATLAATSFDGCRDVFAPLLALSAAAATAARPALVGGATGDVVFRGAVNGDQRYYWAHFDGSAWGAIATQGNFLSTLAPSVARAGGSVHVVFAGTDTNLWDGVVQATGGGSSTQLTGNTSSFAPAAALAPDGKLHVVYTGTNHHLYWFVAAQPATVHDLCDGQAAGCYIVTDAAPSLALAADGAPVAVYHGTDGKLYASRLSGTQWGAPANLTSAETTTLAPAIAGGVDDLADVVYVRASDNVPRHVALTASGWQAPVTVAATALSGAPALATTP
jgi:hypothetical protein